MSDHFFHHCRRLQDHHHTSAAGSTNKCKHAVKMSQCPHRLGKYAFDYEMCLPSTHYKSSDTGFCLSKALPVLALSQLPLLLFTSSSLWLTALPDWSRLELSWVLDDFHNSLSNGHSSNISFANAGVCKRWEVDMGRRFGKQITKG